MSHLASASVSSASDFGSRVFDPPSFQYTEQAHFAHDFVDADGVNRPMLNSYVRGEKVGVGQHGEVYFCHKLDTTLPEGHPNRRLPVALKIVRRKNPKAERYRRLVEAKGLPARSRDRVPVVDKLGTTEQKIRKEIAIMKKLRHPHIVCLYEVIDDRLSDKIYMAMEYLAGGEVKWRNDKNDPVLTVAQTRRIIRDAVLGLEYLHYQGIIHRDIKPANLLWTADRSQVKIGDFGVSHFSYAQHLAASGKQAADSKEDLVLLDDSDLSKRAGTPSFLAPEVIWDFHSNSVSPLGSHTSLPSAASNATVHSSSLPQQRPPITKSIDIWALGVTLYCLLFGKVPFTTTGHEFELYRVILNTDWGVDPTMGSDLVLTGGRHPNANSSAPGAPAILLLDRFLQKDYKQRITLEEVKAHPWITQDLPDPERWIRATSTAPRINVTADEASDAMSLVRFRWNWGARVTQRLTSLFSKPRAPPLSPSPRPTESASPIVSDPRMRLPPPRRKRRTTLTKSNNANIQHVSSSPGLFQPQPHSHYPHTQHTRQDSKKEKGKRKEERERLRENRSHGHLSALPDQASLRKRQRSGTLSLDQHSGHSTALSSPTAERPVVQGLKTWFNRFNQKWGGKAESTQHVDFAPLSSRPQTPGTSRTPTRITRGVDPNTRRSEEALRYYHRSRQFSDSGLLTAARRASSWGQGDEPLEFAEVMSVTSTELMLNDADFVIGAGGIEPAGFEPRSYTPKPRPATSYIPSRRDDEAGPSNYAALNARNLQAMQAAHDFDDSSSLISGYGEGPEARWVSTIADDQDIFYDADEHELQEDQDDQHHHPPSTPAKGKVVARPPQSNGSHDFDSSDEEDDGDEDEDEAVMFSPRKRPLLEEEVEVTTVVQQRGQTSTQTQSLRPRSGSESVTDASAPP